MRITEWKGDWALVTGASSGIGREFCNQLAAAGMSVAMVARRRQRLDEMAADLRDRHGIRTIVIDQDLSVAGAAAAVRNRVAQENVAIRLLINNAAF